MWGTKHYPAASTASPATSSSPCSALPLACTVRVGAPRSCRTQAAAGSTLHVAGSAAVASAWPRSCSVVSDVNRPCRAAPPSRLPPRCQSPPWLLRAAWRSGERRPQSTRAAACGAGAGMLRPPTAAPPPTVTSASAPRHPHPSATRMAAAA